MGSINKFRNIVIIILIVILTTACGCQKKEENKPILVKSINLEIPQNGDVKFKWSPNENDVAYIEVGQEFPLIVWIKPDNTQNKNLKFYTTNSSILIVNNDGKVTGLKPGKAVIYAVSTDDGNRKSNEIEINVVE